MTLSKLAAMGLLLVAFGVIWIALAAPAITWRETTFARLEAARTETARLSRSSTKLNAQIAGLGSVETDNRFWAADQTGEAYALVQGALSRSATENGIAFRAMTPLPAAQREGLESAIVRIEFEADLAQLTGFLRAIEYATPALPVDRATLRKLVRPNDFSRLPALFVQIDIAAPLLIEDGS
jgi:hypothetical protein